MSYEFFQTVMGRKFYEYDIPRIAEALERIAKALERQNEIRDSNSREKGTD